jgi:hypothetical protein
MPHSGDAGRLVAVQVPDDIDILIHPRRILSGENGSATGRAVSCPLGVLCSWGALANVQCPQRPSRSLYDARLLKLHATKKGRAPQRDLATLIGDPI